LAISRARKEELLEIYRQQMAQSSGFMMAEYTALNVAQMQELRHKTRAQDADMYVVTNTLFELLLEGMGVTAPEELLTGPTIVAFCHKDVPPMAKMFREVAGTFEENRFVVKGGMIEGRLFGAADAATVASLPTREELLSQVLRTINAPATQVVGVVAGGIRQVLNVVKAYADKLESAAGASGGTAEAAA
jgi:large subunit ribosomal protein L10